MIVSLVGILAFAGVAILKNRNIAYEAYDYISSGIENENCEGSFDKFRANVVFKYGGADDRYMQLVNSAMSQGLSGCKIYLDYLSVLPEVTKGEQDGAERAFDEFMQAYRATLESYDTYIMAYDNARAQGGNATAVAIMESKEGELVSTYIVCYNKLTTLLLSLHDIVSAYAFGGQVTFEAKSPVIAAGLAQRAISNVFRGTSRDEWLDIYSTNNQDIKNFENYVIKSKSFSSNQEIASTDFKNFVDNINSVDTYLWAKDYETYVEQLLGERKLKAEKAHSYLTNQIIRSGL